MDRPVYTPLSRKPRPQSQRSIFVDGPPDRTYRQGIDVALSHWLSQPVLIGLAGDTATEMALKFVAGGDDGFDLIVNSHIDVDGILATFVLLHPQSAMHHAQTFRQAAHMADHWGWGDSAAQVLFLGATLQMNALIEQGKDAADVYRGCVDDLSRLLGGMGRDDQRIRTGQQALAQCLELVNTGRIERRLPAPRFATYVIPASVHGGDLARAMHIPSFNALITDRCTLWPHARAFFDRERVTLVSVESQQGWLHDLWYPGYAWSQTPDSWRPPGIHPGSDDNHVRLEHLPLFHAAQSLQSIEQNAVSWMAPQKLFPFARTGKVGRKFPVVLSCVNAEGVVAASSLSPQRVASTLLPAFSGA